MRNTFQYIATALLIALFGSLVPFSSASAQNITATSFSHTQPTLNQTTSGISNPLLNRKTTSSGVSPASSSNLLRRSPGTTANQVNLQGFINKVRANGKNLPEIESIINQIKIDAATTTDLMGLFLKQDGIIPITSSIRVSNGNPLKEKLLSFAQLFKPRDAQAFGTSNFGGPLLYSFFCTCSYTFLVWIGPTSSAGTSNLILDYVPYSQMFMQYNMPYTSKAIGKYTPSTSMCYIYYGYGCINVPISEGLISSQVGSSAY